VETAAKPEETLDAPQEGKSGSGKAMTGQQLCQAAHDGNAAKVSTLLSTKGAQSFINYQDAGGYTSRPRKGMRPSRRSSLLRVITLICRSTSLPNMVNRPSQSVSLLRAVT
jgi:hypothetical protein